MTPLIRLARVSVRYDSHQALSDIHWQMNAGSHYAILGANGSGKSTLIKLLSRDIYPLVCDGLVNEQFGYDNWHIWELKQRIGFITHDLHVKLAQQAPLVRGYEAVISSFYSAYGAYAHHDYTAAQKQITEQVMQQLQISHLANQAIGTMSTGELRRCVIARAMVHQPSLLLLDEPTIGLDIKAQHEFLTTIRQLSHRLSIIMVTHHLEEIIPEITHVALIKQGKLVHDGLKQEIMTADKLSDAFDFPIRLTYCQGWYRVTPEGENC
jgi:iron complex transport system ATP-binding protein